MSDLTDDEFVCLSLAGNGENMMAIGRWEKAMDHLVELKLLSRYDKFNHGITNAGRSALAEHEKQVDGALKQALSGARQQVDTYRDQVEQAAQCLAGAARKKQELTSQLPNQAVYELGEAIKARALEILG